jgi:V8-like Glu-specific endopeptidase
VNRIALFVITLLAAVLVAAAQAGAATHAKPGTDESVSSASAPPVTEAAAEAGKKAKGGQPTDEEALAAYWTPERMAAATSADEAPAIVAAKKAHKDRSEKDAQDARGKGGRPEPTGPAGRVEPEAPLAGSPALAKGSFAATFAGYAYYSFPARTAGKVFFTDMSDGRNYVCSGTIVNSEGKNSVWTAGHCVHGGAGGTWHGNWVFVPSYRNGWAPYGQWTARQLWTKTSWISSSDFASDMGVAIMNTRYGWRIVDYLGGQGITWNQSKRIGVTAFGYPADAPFDGQWLYTCTGTTFPEWEFLWWSAETLGLSCDMTGGSSGGGWLAFFNGSSGYLNGNNSYKYDSDPNTMYSPYYDGTASSLYSSTRYL